VGVFGGDSNFDVRTLFEPHIFAIFVGKCIFDAEISISGVGSVNSNLCLFGSAWMCDGMILSTVSGTLILGCSGNRAVSKFSSFILADLEIRGFAISFLTLSSVVFSSLAMSLSAHHFLL